MRPTAAFAILAAALCASIRSEDADAVRSRGIQALKESQTVPRQIVEAARCFTLASDLYSKVGDDEKAVEMNSFLFWCKRKMSLDDINEFTKVSAPESKAKLDAIERSAPADEAAAWLKRAQKFAQANPGEHLLIAIRFFEVAERFKGTAASLTAQDRSLNEMQIVFKAGVQKPAAVPKNTEPVVQPVVRVPVPSAARQKEIETQIKELFKTDYAKNTAESKFELARALLKSAEETKAADEKFVLLREARELAMQSGQATTALKVVAEISLVVELDAIDEKTALIQTLAEKGSTRDSARSIATGALSVIAEALAADRYNKILQLSDVAERNAGKAEDPAFLAETKEKTAEYRKLVRDWNAATNAIQKLKTSPGDPDANAAAGRFYCFAKNDWEHGLAALAKGNDIPLKDAAAKELLNPQDADEQIKVGNAWWEIAEKQSPALKKVLRAHAQRWYELALPNASGLSKLTVEKRLESIVAEGGAHGLMSAIVLKYDALAGNWVRNAEGFACERVQDKSARLQIPVILPAEYDFKASFKALNGNQGINFLLVKNGHSVQLSLGGWANTLGGLTYVNGKHADANPTRCPCPIENGKSYNVEVKVRAKSIVAILDGRQLFEHVSDGSDLSNDAGGPLNKMPILNMDRNMVLQAVEVVDVKGKSEISKYAMGKRYGGDGRPFEEIPQKAVFLTGFRIWWDGKPNRWFDAMQAIYNGPGGRIEGARYGVTRSTPHVLEAKDGYAVGAVTMRVGGKIDAMKLTFMKLDNGVLNPADSYSSEWIGGTNTGEKTYKMLGVPIGIYGTHDVDCNSIGLIFKRTP